MENTNYSETELHIDIPEQLRTEIVNWFFSKERQYAVGNTCFERRENVLRNCVLAFKDKILAAGEEPNESSDIVKYMKLMTVVMM